MEEVRLKRDSTRQTPARLPTLFGDPQRRRFFTVLIVNGVGQAILTVAVALLARHALDVIGSGRAVAGIAPTLLAMVLCALALLGLRVVERVQAERLAQNYLTDARLVLFDHIDRMSSRDIQRTPRGLLMVRFVGDLNALSLWISRGLARVAVAGVSTVLVVLILTVIAPLLATVTALAGGLVGGVALLSASALYRRVRAVRKARGRMAGHIGEKVGATSPAQALGRASDERDRLEKQSHVLGEAMVRRARLSALLRFLPTTTLALATAGVLAFVATMTAPAAVTAGSLLAVILLLNLLGQPLRNLANAFIYRQNYRAARDVLERFLARPCLSSAREETDLRLTQGRLRYSGVRVGSVLLDIDVEAASGDVIVLSGDTGSGKSTLLSLALRLFDPDHGVVDIDDQDLTTVTLASIRRAVGSVSQVVPLVRGSLSRNLRYRMPKAGKEDVAWALSLCELQAFVQTAPEGLKTRLSEGGANLPSGIRQRLLLARAFLGRPPLILIDDADTLIDPGARRALEQVLASPWGTIIVATHDPALVKLANRIWRIEAGILRDAVARPARVATR